MIVSRALKKNLYAVGTVVGSLTVGFAIGYEFSRRRANRIFEASVVKEADKVEKQKQEQIEEVKKVEEAPKEEDEVSAEPTNPLAMSSVSVVPKTSYTKFAEARQREEERLERQKTPGEDLEDANDSEIYEDYDDDFDDFDEGQYHPENIEDDQYYSDYNTPYPHRISVEEFMDPKKRYESISLEYYPKSGVVVDFDHVPVPDYEDFVGGWTAHFDDYVEDSSADVIFIRSNQMKVDVELLFEPDRTLAEALEDKKKIRADRLERKKKNGRKD